MINPSQKVLIKSLGNLNIMIHTTEIKKLFDESYCVALNFIKGYKYILFHAIESNIIILFI